MDLAVKTRDILGKGVKALRKEGLVPAELYGNGVKNVHLSVVAKDFAKLFKAAGKTTVLTLLIEKQKKSAIVQDVVRDAVTGDIAHVDFYEVRMDKKITAKIPLIFKGEAPAVKKGGVLNRSMSEIEIEALPQDLPQHFTVDLSGLAEVNQSIYVRDIAFPKGVTVLVSMDTAVATATPQAAEEVVAPVVDVADVKVESEEKKADRAAEKAAKEEKGDAKPAK